MGKTFEELYIQRALALLGERWVLNPATTLRGLREHDVIRIFPTRKTAEVKADLRAVDRLEVEHATLKHTKADYWVSWIPAFEQFVRVPMDGLQRLIIADERRIRRGYKPLHYRGRRSQWTGGTATFIPIREFIHLPNAQPI